MDPLSCRRRATTRAVFGSYPPLGFRFLRGRGLSLLTKRRMHGAIRYTRARSCSLWAMPLPWSASLEPLINAPPACHNCRAGALLSPLTLAQVVLRETVCTQRLQRQLLCNPSLDSRASLVLKAPDDVHKLPLCDLIACSKAHARTGKSGRTRRGERRHLSLLLAVV